MVMRSGMLVGSFDPFHLGHLDIVERSLQLFDQLYVVVAPNFQKQNLLSVDQRVALIQESLAHWDSIFVLPWEGLTVDFARTRGIRFLVRGLRLLSDMEWEQTLEAFNKHLFPELEIVYLMTRPDLRHISSRALRELIHFGYPIETFVPAPVWAFIQKHFYQKG